MGEHGRGTRLRLRSALAAAVLVTAVLVAAGLGVGVVGTAHAQLPAPVLDTPCTAVARACVDLATQRAWLITDGVVSHGPVPISSGGAGRETPTGDFRVEWKNVNHRSTEFDSAPMPFAVFFAEGGIAFHEGRLDSHSAGCVRLGHEDATLFYDFLEVDDPVQVR
jgi:hypothetical protein